MSGITFKELSHWPGVDLSLAQRCVAADGRVIVLGISAFEKVSIQGVTTGATAWSSAVVTVKLSNCIDGPWVAIPGGSITLTAAGLTTQIDVTAYAFLTLETTTAQASVSADFHICGFGNK